MMSTNNDMAVAKAERGRYEVALDGYQIALSVLMMLLGLHQWAIIVGFVPGTTGTFETMSTAWKIATMHLSVVDLVAAVGLWMRVPWGVVVWVLAALSEVLFHTAFIGTFGSDLPVIALHLATLVAFGVIAFMARARR
jgi:hypothetical protein